MQISASHVYDAPYNGTVETDLRHNAGVRLSNSVQMQAEH